MAGVIFLDGKFIDESEAKVSVRTHALQYGTGCFEGIRAYFNEKDKALYAFRMDAHYQRLLNSSKILFMSIPYTVEELCLFTKQLLQKNFAKEDIYIRPFLFKNEPVVGNFNLKMLKTSIAIYTVAMGRYLNTEKGIKANISSWKRISDNCIPPRAKITGSYVNTALAKTESLLTGYDEALLLDERGHVVEGSAENIFMVKDGVLVTPPVSDDILVGITRNTVITLCKNELNLEVVERSIDRSDIYQADEVFLVGTGAEISPVVEIDKRPIGDGNIGKTGKTIKDLYYQITHGEFVKYKEFVTKVTA